MKNNESFNKYVCGLLDGDGCFCISFSKSTAGDYYKTNIHLYLDLDKANRHSLKLLENIRDYFGTGNITTGKSTYRWTVTGKEFVYTVMRIKKHLVCKGLHLEKSLDVYNKYKGTNIVNEEIRAKLREELAWSRENTGPVKPKKHVSKSWLAGFIDSDGCIKSYIREYKKQDGSVTKTFNGILSFCQHTKDASAIELIAKSFGRETIMNNGYVTLRFHFGNRTKSTANRVLKPLMSRLVLKKWEAEQILHRLKSPAETK